MNVTGKLLQRNTVGMRHIGADALWPSDELMGPELSTAADAGAVAIGKFIGRIQFKANTISGSITRCALADNLGPTTVGSEAKATCPA